LSDCIRELYKNNFSHQNLLQNQDIIHLLVEDIIFYQRPLRSQKSTISNCPLEFRVFKDDGIEKVSPLKVASKSHPIYQEFRLLQWINNLRIIRIKDEKYVTEKFLGNL
jgi:CRISPR-associated endonuclease Csn1